MKTNEYISYSFMILLLFSFLLGNSQELVRCETDLKFYPEFLEEKPELHSPCVLDNKIEIIIAHIKTDEFAIVPVTVENGEPRNYLKNKWEKGNQLEMGCDDFPTLAKTGLHSEKELKRTKTIAGKPVEQITKDGRPGNFSFEGFLAEHEDIISVLKYDNDLVKKLGFAHPELAKPLYHVYNLILEHRKADQSIDSAFPAFDFFNYNGNKIHFESGGAKGWQTSIFSDNNLGYYRIKLRRDFTEEETVFLKEKYSHLSEIQLDKLKKSLSEINTGEMVPYYIMRYGFFEGHTAYRADPIAISFVFGLISLPEIDTKLNSEIHLFFK